MYSLFRLFYTAIIVFILPFLFVRLFFRSLKNPQYRKRWLERVGWIKVPVSNQHGLWFHAVSVGESIAAMAIIKKIHSLEPNLPIMLTTTTPSSSSLVLKSRLTYLSHAYLPYDVPFFYTLFLNKLKPKACILMETELWPNLLDACNKRNIPLMIANGRLSPKSFTRYKKISFLMKNMFKDIKFIAAQSLLDSERFMSLGANKNRVANYGNVKFDLESHSFSDTDLNELKALLGRARPCWVAGSTHEGEEKIMLSAHQKLVQVIPELLLILVPRHPGRFSVVKSLVEKQGFKVMTRSSRKPCLASTQVFLGDSMGELGLFYAASKIAYVGGSLVPIGGHNTLEAVSLKLPVIIGPYFHNFIDITEKLKTSKALAIVNNEEELVKQAMQWLLNERDRLDAGKAGFEVFNKNQGARDKIIRKIFENTKTKNETD